MGNLGTAEELTYERGRKGKAKPKPQSRYASENNTVTAVSAIPDTRILHKKDRSKSRDSSSTKRVPTEMEDVDGIDIQSDTQFEQGDQPSLAEFYRIKKNSRLPAKLANLFR